MRDLIYYYDKTTFEKHELGELQIGFNQSFVIDGTKDSKKVEVYSFNGKRLEPNTIIFHLGTQSWWIVSHDKVERYESEQTPLYLHNLQLEGAIEIFNARDLTDSGFNDFCYDVDTFIKRLLALSTFEFNHTDYNGFPHGNNMTIDYQNNIAPNKTVDYIKTFENYTLLSALREFLDGYNCSAKLEFIESSNTLVGAKLIIVSKTGNANKPAINGEQIFKDPRETKNTDKNNFGTSVVSNAENVVSTKTKTYPSVGGVKLSSISGMEVTGDNSVLRLPSNIFKGNYINLYNTRVPIWLSYDGQVSEISYYDASNENSINNAITFIQNRLASFGVSATITKAQLEIFNIKLPYCDNYDAINDLFITNEILPTINIANHANQKWVFTNDELKPNIKYPDRAVAYSRNRNYISGFEAFFGNGGKLLELVFQDTSSLLLYDGQSVTPNVRELKIGIGNRNGSNPRSLQEIDIKYASFSVNYVPMSDIKIKYDNDGDTIDTNLFNQNGKLNDSNALSKVLLSHSKEIESETITRYGTFYGAYNNVQGFVSNLPKVGDTVYINDDYYVINNISLDFQPNENINENEMGYYITAEVSMSKKVATKSLMTNPNTNIRDYGIPQNNNVKRKQLYRDFYEFSYESDDNASNNWLLPLNKVLNLSNSVRPYQEHIGVIECSFSHEVNGSAYYYYQLETTTYFMKKAVYEILDFKDNNIIGYGYQNLWSGFNISKVLTGYNSMVDLYTIPISYVDEIGEVEQIRIRFATIDQLTQVYDDYLVQEGYVDPQTGEPVISIYNASVFIPSDIYDNLSGNQDFVIGEPFYKKDALEVPVFEYSCQIDDTNEILVGENILDRGNNDVAYLYSYKLVDSGTLYNDNNFEIQEFPTVNVNLQNIATITSSSNNVGSILFDETHIADQEPYLLVKLYASQSYDIDDNVNSMGSEINLSELDLENTTLLIVRNNLTDSDLYTNIVGELALNTVQANLPTASLSNKWKIVVLSDGKYYECQPDQYTYHLGLDTNSTTTFTLIRDGIYLYNNTTLESDLDIDVYEGDTWNWETTAGINYYIVGNDRENGTIHDIGYSHDIVANHYQTISFTKGNGIESIDIIIDDGLIYYTYTLDENGEIIDTLKQEWLYSFSTNLETGWEIVSGGSQDTPIAIGQNANNTLIIQPIAQRKTFTLTANISGSGSGKILLDYTDPDTGTVVVGEELENGENISLKYGTNYSWTAQADSGSYISGTARGEGIIGDDTTTVYTSFGIYRTFSITTASHAQISGWIKRNGAVIKNISATGGETLTYNDLHNGDTYRIEVSAWGTAYYMPSTATTLYEDEIASDLSITTDDALHYHIFNISISTGVNRVRLVINGSSRAYTSSTNDIYVEQGKSYSYYSDPETGYTITSGGTSSGTTNGGTTNISPTAERTKINVRFDANASSGVTVYFNYTDLDSGQTVSTSKAISNSYAVFQVPYGTQGYSWTATSTSSNTKVITGGSGSYGGAVTSQRTETISVGTRRTSTYVYITVTSTYGTSSEFAYATLKASPTYTYGIDLTTSTTNCYVLQNDSINSLVVKKRSGTGSTDTITIHTQDRDNLSASASITKAFAPNYAADSTMSLSSAELDTLFYLVG